MDVKSYLFISMLQRSYKTIDTCPDHCTDGTRVGFKKMNIESIKAKLTKTKQGLGTFHHILNRIHCEDKGILVWIDKEQDRKNVLKKYPDAYVILVDNEMIKSLFDIYRKAKSKLAPDVFPSVWINGVYQVSN